MEEKVADETLFRACIFKIANILKTVQKVTGVDVSENARVLKLMAGSTDLRYRVQVTLSAKADISSWPRNAEEAFDEWVAKRPLHRERTSLIVVGLRLQRLRNKEDQSREKKKSKGKGLFLFP